MCVSICHGRLTQEWEKIQSQTVPNIALRTRWYLWHSINCFLGRLKAGEPRDDQGRGRLEFTNADQRDDAHTESTR
jgi:hypothetical protein